MRVTARIELGDAAPPAAVGRTAYRIVAGGPDQRAQARAGRSGRRSPSRAPDGDLRGRGPQPRAGGRRRRPRRCPGAGTGLIGLAERVSLAGGTLEHGVDPDGAFVLRATPAVDAMIRVLLVDDDALVRSGLRMMLAGAANLDVVAEADGRPRGARRGRPATGPTSS